MFEIGQTVRTKDKIPMEGVIESITPVGSTIKQINITTKHGEFLFKDNELLAVDGVPVVKRSVDIELASLKVMRENFKKSKPVVSVLPDLRTVFDSALAKKPINSLGASMLAAKFNKVEENEYNWTAFNQTLQKFKKASLALSYDIV